MIRLHFAKTEVGTILAALGTKTHTNIIYAAEKKRVVTINIAATSLEEALRSVVSVAGLEFRQMGRTYVVAAPADLQQALKPFAASAVLPLEGAAVESSVKLLESALPYLTVRVAGAGLLISGAEDDIAQARTLLAASNRPYETKAAEKAVQPVKSETRLYAIQYSSAPVLSAFLAGAAPAIRVVTGPETYAPAAPDFHPIAGASLGVVPANSSANGSGSMAIPAVADSGQSAKGKEGDRAKMLILTGPADEMERALRLLKQVDTPPQQVMVEVRVVDTSLQFAAELGLKYNFAPIAIANAPSGTQVDLTTGAPTAAATGPFNSMTFSRLGPGLSAILSAVRTRTDTKLLADPRVQVLDNADANIFIGDTIRTQVSQAGLNGTTIQVLEFPVGIILLVRPRVNSDGRITMHVHPVVSTITGLGPGNLPQTSSREVETTVMVQDGETIVIGGLIRDEYSKAVQEIPLLSKIPLIGELFRNRSTSHRRSDVLVFITPHIVKGP